MNYLSRLAAQTGLTDALPERPRPPAGFDVIEEMAEEIVETPPARVLPHAAPATTHLPRTDPPMPDQDKIVEQVVFEAPAPPQEIRPPATAPDAPSAPPAARSIRTEPIAATPDRQVPQEAGAQPGELRDMRIRKMLEWVAQNERPHEAIEATDQPQSRLDARDLLSPAPAAPPPEPALAEPPALEIRAQHPTSAPADLPRKPPVTDASPPLERALEPAQRRPRDRQPEPAPRIVEERIDISIGTIRLDVRPPAVTAAAPRPSAPPPPAPAPPAAGASAASRLRRRYIRF